MKTEDKIALAAAAGALIMVAVVVFFAIRAKGGCEAKGGSLRAVSQTGVLCLSPDGRVLQ